VYLAYLYLLTILSEKGSDLTCALASGAGILAIIVGITIILIIGFYRLIIYRLIIYRHIRKSTLIRQNKII
jgi:hypothetical protein